MTGVSNEVEQAVARQFPATDAPRVLAALAALEAPPDREDWARARARVHFAILILAKGDVAAIGEHIAGARLDWRDTLCNAGLENWNWPSVLRAAGYPVPP